MGVDSNESRCRVVIDCFEKILSGGIKLKFLSVLDRIGRQSSGLSSLTLIPASVRYNLAHIGAKFGPDDIMALLEERFFGMGVCITL